METSHIDTFHESKVKHLKHVKARDSSFIAEYIISRINL